MNNNTDISKRSGNLSERVAKWDNLKCYLIALVVIGHSMYYFTDYSQTAKVIYLFIYSFHMPAFIFVAGLFAKSAVRERRVESIVEFLLIYVIMKFLDTVGNALSGSGIRFHFFWEAGPGWFALAMAVFLAAAMIVGKYNWKYIMAISIFIGCVAGLDGHFGDHFASMRICTFLPVFFAGYYINADSITKIQEGLAGIVLKIAGIIVLLSGLAVSLMATDELYSLLKLFKGKYEYVDMDMGISGVLFRFACYVFWALMICAIVFATTNRNMIYTWFGQRTMAIFVWHNICLTILLKVLHIDIWLTLNTPHLYLLVVVCISLLVLMFTAYLPEFRISKKLILKNDIQS